MTDRRYPQGIHQRTIMRQLKHQPQNSYPMPCATEERARWGAVKRLADKGLLVIEDRRYRIAHP